MSSQNVLDFLTPLTTRGVSGRNISDSSQGQLPNPFCDIASGYMPRTLPEMFDLTEYLWNTMPPFQEVIKKLVRYFLTEIVIEGVKDKNKEDEISDFLRDINIMDHLASVGQEFFIYGQSFVSMNFPFERFLVCPKCHSEYIYNTVKSRMIVEKKSCDVKFEAHCRKCRQTVTMKPIDRKSADSTETVIKRWNPRAIRLNHNETTNRSSYFLDIQQDGFFAQRLRNGDKFMLDDTPIDVIRVAVKGSGALLHWNKDQIYHMVSLPPAGMKLHGWGIPPILASFKLAYYIQLLRRMDEQIVIDNVIPFKVISPAQNGPADPVGFQNLTRFVTEMKAMVMRKRANITDVQITPFPIEYQELGGQAKTMSSQDLVANAMNELLNSLGFPAEMYNGTMAWDAAPIAIRLLERRHQDLVNGLNNVLAFIVKSCVQRFNWPKDIRAYLRPVSLADDMERKIIMMQAAGGGDISKTTAYKCVGLDYMEEQRLVINEQLELQKLQEDAAAKMEVTEGMDPEGAANNEEGGDAGGGGGAGDMTMDDLHAEARSTAEQLIMNTPETQRRSQLRNIKNVNPTLHALVIQYMADVRRDMKQQGFDMVIQEQQAEGGEAAPPQ